MALAREEAEPRNTHGILLSDALNPTTQWDVKLRPTVDHAARALSEAQIAYYKQWDKDPKNPMNRAGHMWGITKAQ